MLVIFKSIFFGLVMVTLGGGPWAVMVALNIKHSPDFPWAAIVTPFYLLIYWKFSTGRTWPASNAEVRRNMCRAHAVSSDAFVITMIAGLVGLWALIQFQGIYARLVTLPTEQPEDLSAIPLYTLIPTVIVSALVAGVAEESAMRGYLQGPIEKKFGPVVAIVITGVVFGLLHFSHSEINFTVMPWYLGVAIVYGTMAWKTNSVLPSMVLHAGGNMLNVVSLLGQGRSEWQPADRPPLIWETGVDGAFWISVLGFLVLLTISILVFRQVHKAE